MNPAEESTPVIFYCPACPEDDAVAILEPDGLYRCHQCRVRWTKDEVVAVADEVAK